MTLTGSCLCGAIHYRCDAPPTQVYNCHCSQCRRASGGSFATNMLIHKNAFHITQGEAELRYFVSSPGKRRHFCGNCGSPLFNTAPSMAPYVSVRCGTLNDAPPEVRPQAHIWVSSRAPWTVINDDLAQYPEEPPF